MTFSLFELTLITKCVKPKWTLVDVFYGRHISIQIQHFLYIRLVWCSLYYNHHHLKKTHFYPLLIIFSCSSWMSDVYYLHIFSDSLLYKHIDRKKDNEALQRSSVSVVCLRSAGFFTKMLIRSRWCLFLKCPVLFFGFFFIQ